MRPGLSILFSVWLVWAGLSSAQAQVDPVFKPNEQQQNPTNQSITLTRDVYVDLALVRDPVSIATRLTQLLRRAGEVCAAVTDFQVVYRGGNEQRVKMKCPGKRHFGMIINQGGRVVVFGGDGMVGDFVPGDGVIHAISGAVRPETPVKTGLKKGPDLGESGNLPGLLQGGDPNQIPRWLIFVVTINAFIILALIFSFFWFMRVKTQPAEPPKPQKEGMSSAEKDKLIIHSREILPDVYHHPDGFFIARGKRGKRRMFHNLFFAIVYRDYGFKFREIS